MAMLFRAFLAALCCSFALSLALPTFGVRSSTSFSTPFVGTTTFSTPLASTSFAGTASFASTTSFAATAPSFAAPAATGWTPGLPSSTFGAPLKAFTSSTSQPTDPATLARLTESSDLPLLDTPGLEASARLYDQGSFRNWNIEMSQKDINAMNADPTAKDKYPCKITSSYGSPMAKTFSSPYLTCRYKGSVGSLRMCVDEYGRLNGDCRKLSWAVDIDGPKGKNVTVKKEQMTIHGATNMIFGGCPVDGSMMSERMAYSLLNAVNVTAPIAAHAKLFLNGRFLGVYSFVQPIDTTFARERFLGDKTRGRGAMYKEVWFNAVGMKTLEDNRKGGTLADDGWMRFVMGLIDSCPLTKEAALNLFTTHFDIDSLIDITALNSVIGSTDDWRQRHNFLWYIRDGSTGKKVVLLPWDYDRLYDATALTRGVLAGNPWWDIQATALPARCNAPLQTADQLARATANTPAKIAQWTEIFSTLPADNQVPVTCDKITKLLALGIGPQVRERTRQFLKLISLDQIRSWFTTWNAQIEGALAYDPDGPNAVKMREEQSKLLYHLTQARSLALSQANTGDRTYASTSAYITSSASSVFPSLATPFFRSG